MSGESVNGHLSSLNDRNPEILATMRLATDDTKVTVV
jgi:hypothetical protein